MQTNFSQGQVPDDSDYSLTTLIRGISDHLQPAGYLPDREYLDQLMRGELSDAAREEIDQSEWPIDFLPAMQGWEIIWHDAIDELHKRRGESSIPAIRGHMRRLIDLSAAALTAYSTASVAALLYSFDQASEELISAYENLAKHYREFTAYVEGIVQELLPNGNIAVLFSNSFILTA